MKKILYFIMLFLYLIGVLEGIGYALYKSFYVMAIGIAVLGYMAFPKAKECFNNLKIK